ncbi:MAG TPA: beta-ketoacyl synthase N-terminal-like domain-containing protein, partial [Chloroflexota bacterium]|nr:beta-ketoacyl synthase N-terminal-like domain-containing protein [Chloroflexota bacterium]
MTSEPHDGFAIVGIGCRFPGGANSPEEFWRLLRDGVDAITEIPADRFDLGPVYDVDPTKPGKLYARWGGFLERSRIDSFDAGFFGISPREAARIDPQHRLLLEVAWEALEDAGLAIDRLARHPVGVFIGVSTHDYGDIQMYPAHRLSLDAHSNTGTATSIAANRISYLYDFRGPSLTVDTACSSSLTAIHLACQSLRAGDCELALVGGVQVLLVPELTIGFCKATMLSPDGRCKAFDARANGYVRSEGAGVVVLKPLAAARAAGDPIYAVIRGSAVNQDGRTSGLTVPSPAAQEAMVRAALVDARMTARDIQYVEAHGTGTPVGDPLEASAIGAALVDGRAVDERCGIGSVKSNIGHLEAASGMAGLIKTALALYHHQIPPTLHVQQLNPSIDFDGLRLRVVTELEPWPVAEGALAGAGVSSFGFGGSNAHVILQAEPTPQAHLQRTAAAPEASQLLTLSARSTDALRALARSYVDLLSSDAAPRVYDVCATTALRRSHLEHRLSVVASSADDMVDGLDTFLAGDARANVAAGRVPPAGPPKLAFVFSGMGPQWWAMGRQLMASEPVFRAVIDRCDALLQPYAGFSLLEELTRDAASSRVGEADLAQMTNFAIQVALVALWETWGITADAVIGHSAGEMAAAYTAGALDLESAVRLAYHRSRLQSRAAGKGRMLAVGLPPNELADLLTAHGDRVCLAAVNSPGSVTLSGDQDALEALRDTLQERQVFARLLPVEVPYHSQHMDAIRDELLEALTSLAPCPTVVPMVSVVTGDWVTGEPLGADYWWRNVRQPVQFAAGVDRLVEAGFTTFLEVGPHPVLGVSIAECLSAANNGQRATLLASLRRMEDERASMLRAVGVLHGQGRDVAWGAVFCPPADRPGVPLPTYPWQRERHWLDLSSASNGDGPIDTLPGEHPLLGRRVRAARPLWQSRLSDARLDYLDAHLVQGTLVFPGAAYVEMALAASRDAAPAAETSIVLRDVRFERALFITERVDTLVQLGLDAERGRWEIHSQAGKTESGAWTLHATGLFDRAATTVAEPIDLSTLRAACPTQVDRDAFYAALHRRGLNLGGPFQALQELWVGEGEALGAIELAEAFDATPYTMHPALVDAAFQCLVGAVLGGQVDRDRGGVFLPVHIDRVVLHASPPAGRVVAHARVRSAAGEPPRGDVTVVDATGRVCLSISGLSCQVLGAGPVGGAARDDLDDWLYQYRWEPRELDRSTLVSVPIESAVTAALDLAPILARLQAEGDARSAEWDWRNYYATIEERLNTLAAAHVAACFSELGWELEPGELMSTEALATRFEIVPRHWPLLKRLLEILAVRGFVRVDPDSGCWKVIRDSDVAADIRAGLADALLADAPAYAAEIRLLDRCGRHLAGVLRGDMDAREVLFAEPALGLAAQMYRDSPPSRVYNTLSAETIAGLIGDRGSHRPARVLEVGGGTGGTTAYVLPRLAGTRAEYTFTDISPLFTERARVELGTSGQGRLVTQPLDIEHDPAAQGFAPHSFDVVLAANVLHATADLERSLGHARRLLAPGGVLVIQEITRNPFWLDLIFGLTDGWWRFTDRELRPAHPLLAEHQWRGLLERSGFEDVGSIGDSLPTGGSAQAVIIGRTPTPGGAPPSGSSSAATLVEALHNGVATHMLPPAQSEWLIFADAGGVGARVAESLEHRGQHCTLVSAAGRNGNWAAGIDAGGAAGIDAGAAAGAGAHETAAVAAVLAGLGQRREQLRGVVYLRGLDAPNDAAMATEILLDAAVSACADVLGILQAIGRHEQLSCDLTIVTRGSQSTNDAANADVPGDAQLALSQTPLWGLARVAMREQARPRCRLI